MITISLEGLASPSDDDRNLAYIKVDYDGVIYDWQVYVPADVDLTAYLEAKKDVIIAQINAKEAIWATTPKTKIVSDPFGVDTEIEVFKNEIVRPDVPDYYVSRKKEYPSLTEQLGALWKGEYSSEYADMINKINDIKNKYKPSVQMLDDLKAEKIAQIEKWRATARFANGVANGRTWQLDEKSQALLGQAILIATVGGPLPTAWFDVDNVPMPITNVSELLNIASVAAANTDAAFVRSQELKSIVRDPSTDTAEKLDAIVW
jgi:hypothetical protein